MADDHDPRGDDWPPLLTDPAVPTEEVPVLVDAVAEQPPPMLEPAPPALLASPETVAALREALTLIATDVARECLDETLKEARAGLHRRLSDRFEEELRTLIERALRSHLHGDG